MKGPTMLTIILLVTVLSVLYGLAWHNQPVKANDHDPRPNRKS